MNKFKLIMHADIYTDIDDSSDFWNKYGNNFQDDFYILLKKYTGNSYLFRNNSVELRLLGEVDTDE